LTGADAPACVRLALHDAGTYDQATKTGGFDGSILLKWVAWGRLPSKCAARGRPWAAPTPPPLAPSTRAHLAHAVLLAHHTQTSEQSISSTAQSCLCWSGLLLLLLRVLLPCCCSPSELERPENKSLTGVAGKLLSLKAQIDEDDKVGPMGSA